MDVDGPRLELWRAPTDNDRSSARGSFELGRPEETNGEGVPGPSSEQRWRERGLDRLVHRLDQIFHDHDQLLAVVRASAAGTNLFVDVTYQWRLADGLALLVSILPSPGWDCTWPRVGVRFDLPRELRHASWFGTGPERVLSRHAAGGTGRPFCSRHRRAERRLLPPPGDRTPQRAALAGDLRRNDRAITRHDLAEPGAAPPRLHTERVHATAARSSTPSVRARSRAIASTCSWTTQCMASAHARVASMCCPSMRCGRAGDSSVSSFTSRRVSRR